MLNNLDDFQAAVERLVRDGAGVLGPADYGQYLLDAVKRLSRVEPREVVQDIAGDGSFDYDLPAPYDPAFSTVLLVEYPAGEREPSYVDKLDWRIYTAPSGAKLRFLADTPAVGETIRVTHTALHELDGDSTTVPEARQDAVVLLGAGISCEALASHYANTGDSLIGADSVDHASKAKEYSGRAKRFIKMADELLPVPEQGSVRAASDQTSVAEDRGFLTHPER